MQPVFAFLVLIACLTAGTAAAETVRFPGAHGEGYPFAEHVEGELKLPKGAAGRVPAVVILHGSAGPDERGPYYAEALNAAGIATLEVVMFEYGNKPRRASYNFTHMYGALRYLSVRPDIDPARIGVMGFSWGGNLSLRATSRAITQAFMGPSAPRFAAHAPVYPVCWRQTRIAKGGADNRAYAALTGAPVLIFAAGQDDNNKAPDDCAKFVAALPEAARGAVGIRMYPDATHGWDRLSRGWGTVGGNVGKSIRVHPVRETAEKSRAEVVAFFTRSLKPAR